MMLRLGVLALLVVFVFGEESVEKRDYAPALEAEEVFGNMRALFNVGKRQLSLADDTDAQWQMYKQLYSAGKRKRSSLAPSQQFSNYARLLDAGKKRSLFAPSQELGMYSQLMEAGKKRSSPFAPSQDLGIYSQLYEAGKKRSYLTPAADLSNQMAIGEWMERAGRK